MEIKLTVNKTTYTFTQSTKYTVIFSVMGETIEISPDKPFEDIDDILKDCHNMDPRTAQVMTSLYYNAPYLEWENSAVIRAIMDHIVLHILDLLKDVPTFKKDLEMFFDESHTLYLDCYQVEFPSTGSEFINYNITSAYTGLIQCCQ
jgi:hypothetical protein